jgi:hypothetical protein
VRRLLRGSPPPAWLLAWDLALSPEPCQASMCILEMSARAQRAVHVSPGPSRAVLMPPPPPWARRRGTRVRVH